MKDHSYYLAKNFDVWKLPHWQTIPVIFLGDRPYWHVTPESLAWFTQALENAEYALRDSPGDLAKLVTPARILLELEAWASLVYPQEELTKISNPTYIPRLPEPVLKGPEI